MSISLIVAMNHKRVIGINNTLPWHLPDDLRYFKKVTANCPVIMGRKTHESIGRPLPNRTNIILTRDVAYRSNGCVIDHHLLSAVDRAKAEDREIFIIGGAELYKQALPLCAKIYLTIVENHDHGDTYFPASLASLQEVDWAISDTQTHSKDDQHAYAFTWYTLKKTEGIQ